MRKVTISVYEFSELSDASKEVAIENYRSQSQEWDNPFEDFDEGLDYAEQGFSKIETRISLHSQGGGVSFDSVVDLSKFVPDRVKNNPSLLRLVKNNVTVTTEANDSNSYSFPAESDVKMSDEIEYHRELPRVQDFLEKMLHNIRQEYMKICKELEKQAYEEEEGFFGDERIESDIEANEYEFLASGERFVLEHLIED